MLIILIIPNATDSVIYTNRWSVLTISIIQCISQMNDRLRSMEYEITNRISNIEALLHQQQRFQSIPHLGMHPATNGYGMNPYQLYPGAQYSLNPIHPHGHPTVRPTHINPMSYQGYPIIPVDLAHMHQYSNLPRMNLLFRSEQLPQNPLKGTH